MPSTNLGHVLHEDRHSIRASGRDEEGTSSLQPQFAGDVGDVLGDGRATEQERLLREPAQLLRRVERMRALVKDSSTVDDIGRFDGSGQGWIIDVTDDTPAVGYLGGGAALAE